MNEERMITLPVDKVRHAVDMIVASMDFGSNFFDQEDTDFLRDLAAQLGDVCPQAVTPTNMRYKYPPCSGTETWVAARRAKYMAQGGPVGKYADEMIRNNTGHDDHPYPA